MGYQVTAAEAVRLLHQRGYGVTVATWAGEPTMAVVAYLSGRPVASAHAPELDAALERLRREVLAGEERI